jgi:Pilus assembly protein, PilO
VSLSDRDKKIVVILIPLLAVLGYWFLLLSPKREEATKAEVQLAKQEKRRDSAQQRVSQLSAAKTSFASDYTQMARLGKAIPSAVDMPSLIVQLDAAARGTGIHFKKIARSEDAALAGSTSTTQAPAAPGSGNGSQPAAAGGAKAQSFPGKAAEAAGNATNAANSASSNAESAAQQSGLSPGDAQTSASARQGGLPVGGGSSAPSSAAAGAAPAAPAGLQTVKLDLEFDGSFFRLTSFFHRVKRFVQVANDRITVHGRLITIDALKFSSDPETFPALKAEMTATVYLSPKAEGVTGGATPQGPAQTTPASTGSGEGSSPSPATTPTATATP